jgi:hypothetical protein
MGIYVRADRRKDGIYYWLVESHREGKRVVQKRIKYLGTSPPPPAILEKLKQEYKSERNRKKNQNLQSHQH